MSELILIPPTARYAEQVMQYRGEMLENHDSLDGCAGLEGVSSYDEWLDFDGRLRKKYGDGYTPSRVFLAVRKSDDRVVGIMDLRYPLTDFLLKFGGNIGYSVRPCERRRGYAAEMLGLLLPICREAGLCRVLVTCDGDNIASARTIEKNGGRLENEVADTAGLGKSGIIRRYFIELTREIGR